MSENNPTKASFDPTTFDDHALFYEELLSWSYRQELELPTLKQLLGDISGLNVMDFGCGPGVTSRWLHKQGAKKIIGYDISTGMISYAKQCEEKDKLGIDYISKLDEKYNNYFDIVLAVYVMPYVVHQQDLLSMSQDLFKMLKSGGKLLTLPIHPDFNSDPEYYRPFGFRLIEKEPRQDGSKLHLHLCKPPYDINLQAYYWSKQTLENTLGQAGFQHVAWKVLKTPTHLSAELASYAKCPHVAIIEAIK